MIGEKQDAAVSFRIPRAMLEELKKRSFQEYRSVNGVAIMLLKDALIKPRIEELSEEFRKVTSQLDLLTVTVDSLSRQVAKTKKEIQK